MKRLKNWIREFWDNHFVKVQCIPNIMVIPFNLDGRLILRVTKENGKLEQWLDAKTLGEYKKIVVETDEENPTTIAAITPNARNAITGYRVRMIPVYEKAGDK